MCREEYVEKGVYIPTNYASSQDGWTAVQCEICVKQSRDSDTQSPASCGKMVVMRTTSKSSVTIMQHDFSALQTEFEKQTPGGFIGLSSISFRETPNT